MAGSVLVVISDTHIGSSTALAPLEFSVHNRSSLEVQTLQANRLQRWVYENWLDFWQYVKHIQGKKKRLIVAHLGDVIDGNYLRSTQIVQEVGDQEKMAMDLLEPIRSRANTFIGILGTAAHAGPDHAVEADIYRQLGADYVDQQMTVDIDGIRVDLAHHGRMGTRPWTSGAANLASEIMLDYAQSGIPLPHYIFRGHFHALDDSGAKFENTRLIQCPAWQLKTTYANRVAGNVRRSDIGGVIVVDGQVDLSKSRYCGQPDGRKIILV